MAMLPSPDEVNLPGRVFFRSGLQSQIAGAALRLGEGALTSDNWWGHLGDESQNPPAWPTNKTIGDFDWTNLDPRFTNINLKTINHLDPQSWIYQYITGTNNENPVLTVITTVLTFKVYGPGADFANFDAFSAWISQRTISSTGRVIIILPAGKIAINSRIILAHPNGDRISVQGQPLNQALPAENSLQCTGNSVAAINADVAINLGRLRQSFSTELVFTNGGGIDIIGSLGNWQDILCTSDQSIAPGAQFSDLISNSNGTIVLRRSAVVGANFAGLRINNASSVVLYDHFYAFGNGFAGLACAVGSVINLAGGIACMSNGFLFNPNIGGGGLIINYGSVFYAISFLDQVVYPVVLSGNVGAGLVASGNCSFSGGRGVTANLNSTAGLQVAGNCAAYAAFASLSNNAIYDVFITNMSQIDLSNATIYGSQYGIYASGGSQAYRPGASINGQSIASLSPALNTLGNANALIT